MTVRELIKSLRDLDPESEVFFDRNDGAAPRWLPDGVEWVTGYGVDRVEACKDGTVLIS